MSGEISFEPSLDPFPEGTRGEDNNQIPLENKWKQLANINFGESDTCRGIKIKELQDLIKKTNPDLLKNIPGKDPNDFLLKFLRAGNFNVTLALKALTRYIEMLKETPSYFALAFITFDKIQKVFDILVHDMSPVRYTAKTTEYY